MAGAKIRQCRTGLGMSQSELADVSGLSLRTIQRIENNKNVPRAYTLRVIAEALETDAAQLAGVRSDKDDSIKKRLEMMNMSTLTFLVIPFGNLIFPIVSWNRSSYLPDADAVGRRLVNFQISWSVITYTLLAFAPFINRHIATGFPLIFMVLIGAFAFNVYVVLENAKRLRAANHQVRNGLFKVL